MDPANNNLHCSHRVLVTGATGRIGRIVVEDLLERGYAVRATTSKADFTTELADGRVEWRHFDFLNAVDYDALVAGCVGILHLAAELGRSEVMPRVNAEATLRLAEAAERQGVRAFCYTSSVAVYGSGRVRNISEDAPVLTVDKDIKSEYWALSYVRCYGRTKLAGEMALQRVAKSVRYTIFRPTVVVDVSQIVGIREWSGVKRTLAAHRHSHHVYVRDVSDALIWALERGIERWRPPGSVEVFNLSEDDYPNSTHAAFLRRAYKASGDRRFRVMNVPGLVDWLHDLLRFHTLPLRNPLWRMYFPNDRLRAAGYIPRFGIAKAYDLAIESIRKEAESRKQTPDGN